MVKKISQDIEFKLKNELEWNPSPINLERDWDNYMNETSIPDNLPDCPFINNSFYSKSIREINLSTNEKSVATIHASLLEPKKDEFWIDCFEGDDDEGVKIPWSFVRKDNKGNFYLIDQLKTRIHSSLGYLMPLEKEMELRALDKNAA